MLFRFFQTVYKISFNIKTAVMLHARQCPRYAITAHIKQNHKLDVGFFMLKQAIVWRIGTFAG